MSGPGTNTGYGHVWARPDGTRARCGGPGICGTCGRDKAWLDMTGEKLPDPDDAPCARCGCSAAEISVRCDRLDCPSQHRVRWRADDRNSPSVNQNPPPFDSEAETRKHIMAVAGLLGDMAAELIRRAAGHDRSKLEEPEKSTFDRVTPLLKTLVYGSPEYKASLADMGPALAHHYAHNSHHPEHYPDGVAGMDLLDVVEMACDWTAAHQRHDAHRGQPWTREDIAQRAARFGIEPQLASVIWNTLAKIRLPT